MAVIGATQIEPVNFLGEYARGLQVGAGRRALEREEIDRIKAADQQDTINALIRSGAVETAEGRNLLSRTPGGFAALKAYGEAQEQMGKGLKGQTEGLSSRLKLWKQMLPNDPSLAPNWVNSAYNDPIVGPELQKFGTKEQVISKIPSDLPGYIKWAEGISMFADEYAQRRTMTAEQEATAETARRGQDITAETARRGQDITAETTRRGQDIERDTKERAQNLETFFGKDKAGKETAKDVAGAEAFQGVISEMRDAYNELDRLNAIPSSKRRTAAENLGIYATETSGAAQMAGRIAGTPAQSLRNQVQSARLRLLQGIKAATNMSAQELNSNVELQQWLDAVTNPANDIESNMAVLQSIEDFVATKSGKKVPAKPKPKPAASPSSSIDALLEKYKE
jgi:hypothetical protein